MLASLHSSHNSGIIWLYWSNDTGRTRIRCVPHPAPYNKLSSEDYGSTRLRAMDRYGSDMQALQTSSACSCCLDPSCHDSSDLLDTSDGACRQLSPRCRPAYDIAASCCTAMEVAGELVQSGNTSCTGICRHHLGQACTDTGSQPNLKGVVRGHYDSLFPFDNFATPLFLDGGVAGEWLHF